MGASQMRCGTHDKDPALAVSQDLHPAGEHGPQHGVILCQGSDRRVKQAATHIQLYILTERQERLCHEPMTGLQLYSPGRSFHEFSL